MVASMGSTSTKSTVLHCTSSSREFGSNFSSGFPIKGISLQLKTRRNKAGNDVCLLVSATTGSRASEQSNESGVSGGRFYLNFTGFPFPLGPFLNRRTIRTEAVKDTIWLFEQEQALGFSSVSTNIRMTVIKLKSGELWVHAPIAPTKECIQLVKELGYPVKYIVLPTFAYEHKIFVGPFSRKFPKAQIWVAPRQWSWPLNLPLEFFGIFRAITLKDGDISTPWADDIEQKVLSSPEVGIGPYVEVAFYHKQSRTLLVTDAVIFVPRTPPECISKESLLAAAKNGLAVKLLSKGKDVPEEPVVDNQINRQKGWERMVLQILFLGPSNLLEPNASFAQMSQKLIVSPIVKTLVFSKVPEKRMKESEIIKDYADWLLDLANKVRLFGKDFTDERIVQKIFVTLPEKYEATISSLENSKNLSSITLAELVNALQALEQRRIMRKAGSVGGAFQAKSQNESYEEKKKN
ncbi:T4P13.26 protein isoform 2 [Capsicum annuum]|nr:T4P13.26 protein isoform 2 [Capsicum annuum]